MEVVVVVAVVGRLNSNTITAAVTVPLRQSSRRKSAGVPARSVACGLRAWSGSG